MQRDPAAGAGQAAAAADPALHELYQEEVAGEDAWENLQDSEVCDMMNDVSLAGEAGSAVFQLSNMEGRVLLFRSMCTYITLVTYWCLYLYMCQMIATSSSSGAKAQQDRAACLRFLLYSAFIFLLPSSLALVLSDLYCLLLCARRCRFNSSKGAQGDQQLLEELESNISRLFVSPLFAGGYAWRRGNGFSPWSREALIMHVAFYGILLDLPTLLVVSMLLSTMGLSSIGLLPLLCFSIAVFNTVTSCFLVPFILAKTPKPLCHNDAVWPQVQDQDGNQIGAGGGVIDRQDEKVMKVLQEQARRHHKRKELLSELIHITADAAA